jgi:hypothetical protein
MVAQCWTKTPRPSTQLLRSETDVNEHVVVKREGSDCCNDVHWGMDLPARRVKQMLAEKSSYRWIVQTEVPTLRTVGEIRVYVVGGHIIKELSTIPDGDRDWDLAWVDRIRTVEEMQSVFHISLCYGTLIQRHYRVKLDSGADGYSIIHRDGGTLDELQAGRQQLHDFVLDTLNALVKIEKSRTQATVSSLEHLARVDVSVMHNDSGELAYFVNEVERGVSVCLYSRLDSSRSMEIMDEFREVVTRWLDSD